MSNLKLRNKLKIIPKMSILKNKKFKKDVEESVKKGLAGSEAMELP